MNLIPAQKATGSGLRIVKDKCYLQRKKYVFHGLKVKGYRICQESVNIPKIRFFISIKGIFRNKFSFITLSAQFSVKSLKDAYNFALLV